MTFETLTRALITARRGRLPRRRRIKTAYLPRDSFRALVLAEGLRTPSGLYVVMPWGPVAIVCADKQSGNARYL